MGNIVVVDIKQHKSQFTNSNIIITQCQKNFADCRFQECIASKWIEIDQESQRIGTAKAVERLMSFAQITCIYTYITQH